MKTLLLLLHFALFVVILNAQPKRNNDKNIDIGLKIGAVNSKITDFSTTLVSENYYTDYSFKNPYSWGFTGSIYINYKISGSISAIYSEVSYCRLGNLLQYSDIENLHYDLELRYEYINWELFYKVYFFEGFHVSVGSRLGFNILPNNLFYTSDGEERFGPDIRIQQQMRDVLKGRPNFSVGIGLGYEFPMGLNFDLRYYNGFSDVVETEVNNFHFIENKNLSRCFQFTIGYTLPYLLYNN